MQDLTKSNTTNLLYTMTLIILILKNFSLTKIFICFLGLAIGYLIKNSYIPCYLLDFFSLPKSECNLHFVSGFIIFFLKSVLKEIILFVLCIYNEEVGISGTFLSSSQPVSPPSEPISPPARPVSPPAQPVSSPAQPVSPPSQPVSPPAQPAIVPPAYNVIHNPGFNPDHVGYRPGQVHPDTAWPHTSCNGNGFVVNNGEITVNNPFNIRSFYNGEGEPNRSPEAKAYAKNIGSALGFHSASVQKPTCGMPRLDNLSQIWLREFIAHHYPTRDPNAIYNSSPIRRAINRYSR